MPSNSIVLKPTNFYHIYNRGINSCDIFFENDNYEHFLHLYDKYISPVANTFAWVLMKNHFHLLVQILPQSPDKLPNLKDLEETTSMNGWEKRINQQFSNLFNAYTKAVNKRFGRTGSLLEHSFHRKLVENESYLKQLIVYIHQNPVHHGFCAHPCEYPWSSYLSCISLKPTQLKRDEVIGWFNNKAAFEQLHNEKISTDFVNEWLTF